MWPHPVSEMYCRMLALASHGLSGPASGDIGPVHTACIGVSVAIRRAGSHPPFVRFWRPVRLAGPPMRTVVPAQSRSVLKDGVN
jgi:hypothetical protein